MSKKPKKQDAIRRIAAAQLARSPLAHAMSTRPVDRLGHELHVHQIELEMQNEELRRTHLELAASHDRYVDLYDFAPVGYFTLKDNGIILEANLTGAALLGVERNTLRRRRFSRFVTTEEILHWHRFLSVIRRGERQSCELVLRRRDKSVLHAHLDGLYAASQDNTPAMVRITLTDISERKQAEDALRKERDFTREMVNSLPGVFYLINQEGRFQAWNRRFEEVTGYTPEEILVASPAAFFQGEELAIITERVREVFTQGFAVGEASLVAKNGTMTPHYFVGQRIELDGMPYLVGMGLDISERKRMENALREAKEQTEMASRAKGDFLTAMSHEIRTPMNVVLGMSEMLLETDLAAEQCHLVQTMHRSGKALLGVINDVLDFSRIEAGRFTLSEVAFSPRQVVEETAHLMRVAAEEKGLVLLEEVASGIPEAVLGDDGRVRQVLINLIGNAIKFTRNGRICMRLTRHLQEPGTLLFCVSDTGIGIAPEHINRIFELFTQADSGIARRYGGTGLGLTISRKLMELMGGRIWVESLLGQGSTFFFTLPARLVAAPSALAGPVDPTMETTTRSLHILLAEDSPDNQILFQLYLRKTRHRLVVVNDGFEAVARVREEPFDLILMDIQMPNMDGYAATLAIRQWEKEEKRPPLAIMALSAHAGMGKREESLAAGCDGHLTKPIKKQTLLEAIQHVAESISRQDLWDAMQHLPKEGHAGYRP
ncbi:MAG: PAS domain S-box protein [Magnetococcales bacterium]|nr:PAS domain S-box protein [Magnetococcales bacterium]